MKNCPNFYKKIEKVLADKEIPDRIVYVYLKYYAFLEPKEELKKQLVASLETCIGEFDVARAGIKIRMLLINPAFQRSFFMSCSRMRNHWHYF